MAENIDLNVNVNGFQSLRAQLKEAQKEYQLLVGQINATPAAITAAAQKVADLKDRFDDANDSAKALTGAGKFQAVTKTLSALAGGFTAIQGAITLAGGDAKNFEKTMQKLQGAMALTQGLEALEGLPQAFTDLKTVAVGAFNSIKAAIGSTGIGLLVIALGTIVAYWDEITALVSGVSDEQEALNAKTAENVALSKANTEALDNQENILKQQGKSEEEINELKIASLKVTLQESQALLAQQEATRDAQVKASERNKEILQGIIRFINAPITLLLSAIDSVGKAFGKNFGLEEGFSGSIAKFVFDPEAVKKKGDETIKTTKNEILKLQNSIAGLENQNDAIRQGKAEKKKADDEKKRQDDLKKLRDTYEKEIQLSDNQYKELILAAKEAGQDTFALEQAQLAAREKIQRDARFKELNLEQEALNTATTIREKNLENKTKIAEAEKKLAADTANALAVTEQQKNEKQLRDLAKYYDDLIVQYDEGSEDYKNLVAAKELALQALRDEFKQKDLDKQKGSLEKQKEIQQMTFDAIAAAKEAQLQLELSYVNAVAGLANILSSLAGENTNLQKAAVLLNQGAAIAGILIESSASVAKQIAAGNATGILLGGPILNPVGYFANAAAVAKGVIATKIGAGIGVAGAIAGAIKGIADIDKAKAEANKSKGQASSAAEGSKASMFAQGGLLLGAKHSEGGMMTPFGELEGGEFVVNRSATAAFLPLLNAINGTGNGSGAPNNLSASAESSMGGGQPIIKTYVVASEITTQQEADQRIAQLARL